MRLSIFNFKQAGNLIPSSNMDRKWWLLLSVCLLLVYVGSTHLLEVYGGAQGGNEAQIRAWSALNDQTKILFTGSSHVSAGINPEWIGLPSVVLASSADYTMINYFVRAGLERAPNVKLVVIEIDNLCLYNIGLRGSFDLRQFADAGLNLRNMPLTDKQYYNWIIFEVTHLNSIFLNPRLTLRDLLWPKPNHCRVGEKGFYPYVGIMNTNTWQSGVSRIKAHEAMMNPGLYKENKTALLDLCQWLNEREVPILFIKLPHHQTYWKNAGAQWNASTASLIEGVQHIMGKRFKLLDLERAHDLEDEDFYDGHHVNINGARKVSRELDHQIKQRVGSR